MVYMVIMKFGEWLRLDEWQHISFKAPTLINGIHTDSIDFRFEDWRRGFNPSKHHRMQITGNGQRFLNSSFSAPIQGGWVNVNREQQPMTQGNLALKVATQPVQIGQEAAYDPLPKHWIDFAVFYLGHQVVKSPEWPRDDSEMNPYSVAELE